MARWMALLLLATATACGDSGKASVDDTGGTGGDDTGGGGGDDGESPVIESADAYCYLHKVGSKAYFWIVEATATDPQGVDTIASVVVDGVVVTRNGADVATYDLVCTDGDCTTSFAEAVDGVSCMNADSYTFSVTVEDVDGNRSQPYSVQGREADSSKGR